MRYTLLIGTCTLIQSFLQNHSSRHHRLHEETDGVVILITEKDTGSEG